MIQRILKNKSLQKSCLFFEKTNYNKHKPKGDNNRC